MRPTLPYRRSLLTTQSINRCVLEIRLNDVKECISFHEMQHYVSDAGVRDEQHYYGDIYLNQERSILSLPAYHEGQVRLTLIHIPQVPLKKERLKMRGAFRHSGCQKAFGNRRWAVCISKGQSSPNEPTLRSCLGPFGVTTSAMMSFQLNWLILKSTPRSTPRSFGTKLKPIYWRWDRRRRRFSPRSSRLRHVERREHLAALILAPLSTSGCTAQFAALAMYRRNVTLERSDQSDGVVAPLGACARGASDRCPLPFHGLPKVSTARPRAPALRLRSAFLSLRERREVESFRRSEPDHVLGVVLEVVAGVGVRQDGEATPVGHEPGYNLAKHLRLECELAATTWMRPYWFIMQATDHDAEDLTARSHSWRASSRRAASK